MNNKNGGQASANPPSWNAWGQTAAENAASVSDDSTLSSAQRQQQTATELARKKVLEAYKTRPQDYKTATTNTATPQVRQEDWRKYHSAWQDYYQKYYGEYYGKAAQEYVAREKMKLERELAEKARKEQGPTLTKVASGNGAAGAGEPSAAEVEEIQNSFRERIRKTAEKRARRTNGKARKWIPLGIGIFVLICGVLLQYNQVIAAHVVAYMSPGDNTSNTISALDPTLTVATHDSPYLMIPKLNVEVPVVFGSKTDVSSMNVAMSNGVANFSVPGASAKPGEIGNFVISGHSAGNVYQNTNYKFIFSGLPRLVEGDLIYMDYEGVRYTYKLIGTMIVDPSDVNSLVRIANDNPDKPLITLLTCYPLGTSKQRYIVYAEQINPSYENATTAAPSTGGDSDDASDDSSTENVMPQGDPSPLEQLWKWLTGQE